MKKFFSSRKKKAIISAVAAGICFGNISITNAADLPSFFDWRLTNPTDSTSGADELSIVSPVEKQEFGTCWTFSTFGSYESSWLKQLKDAQAAGYNVTPERNLFSKLYLAWLPVMPPADNSNDTSIYEKATGDGHPVYDTGGSIERAVSILLRYGAIDANAVTLAKTDEERANAANLMNTEANWNRLKESARSYLGMQYGTNILQYRTDLSNDEAKQMYNDYLNSLTDEQLMPIAQNMFNALNKDAVMTAVTPKGILHDSYVVKSMLYGGGLTDEEIADTKELIQTEGLLLWHTA